ncbi:MAG: hypothetical protein HY399_08635 [Elusimicrobia bacterium]|nr:hypothetical protein [Elusimicrobiota bacterium]
MASPKLTPQEQKALEDLIGSGIENSIQAMAKLYRENWSISSSSFRGGAPQDFYSTFKDGGEEEAGVYFSVQQDVPISFLIIFPRNSIQSLVDTLGKKHKASLGTPLKMEEVVLGEVGNILVNSFLGKLSDSFARPFLTSTPHFVRGPKRTLLDATLTSLEKPKDQVLMAHVHMFSDRLSADCDFLSIFNSEFIQKLIKTYL